jgi:hypothetical protein
VVIPTRIWVVPTTTVAISLDEEVLKRCRLARECANLEPDFEVAMAEEGLSAESGDWPEYGGCRSGRG